MSITREQLEQMKKDVQAAEREFEKSKAERQRAVLNDLLEIKEEIDNLILNAEAIADSVDLKFYYHTGYDEFKWSDADTWNSSSANC